MRIQIVARHCSPSELTRERAVAQFDRLTRYHPRLTAAEVIFREGRREMEVEGVLSIDGHDPVVARGVGESFDIAADQVIDRLGRILRKLRAKDRDHKAPPLHEAVVSADATADEEEHELD